MKLYSLSQTENNDYDTYSNLVVCSASEDEARLIHPGMHPQFSNIDPWKNKWSMRTWCTSPDQVKVEYIGEASDHLKVGIICAAFHAG